MVLEVGPGTGNMTVKLLEKAKKVRGGGVGFCVSLKLAQLVYKCEHFNKLTLFQ